MDYCTKNDTEADFNAMMLDCGLCVEITEGEGEEAVTSVVPASNLVLIDRIGPITMQTGVDEDGEPVFVTYPEYYTNVRLLMEPTDEQDLELSSVSIDPSQPQYRQWA
jgi:hypothetical protein